MEQGFYEACTGVICKKLYELVQFLQLYYNLQEVKLFIHLDKGKAILLPLNAGSRSPGG